MKRTKSKLNTANVQLYEFVTDPLIRRKGGAPMPLRYISMHADESALQP